MLMPFEWEGSRKSTSYLELLKSCPKASSQVSWLAAGRVSTQLRKLAFSVSVSENELARALGSCRVTGRGLRKRKPILNLMFQEPTVICWLDILIFFWNQEEQTGARVDKEAIESHLCYWGCSMRETVGRTVHIIIQFPFSCVWCEYYVLNGLASEKSTFCGQNMEVVQHNKQGFWGAS